MEEEGQAGTFFAVGGEDEEGACVAWGGRASERQCFQQGLLGGQDGRRCFLISGELVD